ncbi:MAG TPA: hypothetical protein VGM21_20485 [Actinomycetota bacterium]|jgi:hypothetical protein
MPSSDAGRGERAAYLPPRAAKARKLILRSQLGLPWLVGATVVAGVILVAGTLLLARGGRPGSPWVRVEPLAALPAGTATEVAPAALGRRTVVVVDRRGGLRAFVAPAGGCPVIPDGGGFTRPCSRQSWDADGGARTPHTPPLTRVPTRLASGDLYVNATNG